MKKLTLIVLSLILPVIALATDADSFKKGYQWGQQVISTGRSTSGGPTSDTPSFVIPRIAQVYQRTSCPSADMDSFIAGFYQAYEDYGKVMPMDDPSTRTSVRRRSTGVVAVFDCSPLAEASRQSASIVYRARSAPNLA
jgi:hypothetical protein